MILTDNDKLRILIINGDISEIMVLRDILYGEYDIDVAQSTHTALHSISDNKPDIILLSSHLRGASCIDMLPALLDFGNTRSIPILIIGDSGQVDIEESALKIGAADYIPRPINSTVLRARI
ncbi:MAG: response regulator, partial [Oscillospiraceae bacterium]|nr:response regulator [Oscillospiraceae bacterium]